MTIDKIKKALECCINPKLNCCNDCPYNNNGRLSCLESEMLKDALNLINELESENERLKTQLAQANAGIVNCSGCKLVELNAVKEFAERLKNKLFEFFQDNEELDGKISVGPLYVDVIGVEAKDGTIISLGLIDKLLKEYEVEE